MLKIVANENRAFCNARESLARVPEEVRMRERKATRISAEAKVRWHFQIFGSFKLNSSRLNSITRCWALWWFDYFFHNHKICADGSIIFQFEHPLPPAWWQWWLMLSVVIHSFSDHWWLWWVKAWALNLKQSSVLLLEWAKHCTLYDLILTPH